MEQKIYDVRERAYRYARQIVKFLETLPRDDIAQTTGKQRLRAATPREQVKPLLDETHELSCILAASVLTLKGKRRA